MKRLFLLAMLFAVGICVNDVKAQTSSAVEVDTAQCVHTSRYYLDIQGIQGQLNAKAFEIKIVSGKIFHDYTKTKPSDLTTFRDKYQLRTMMDALNLLSLYGWQLSQCYTTAINGSVVTHYIVYKDGAKPEDFTVGIIEQK
jgi:hypothetical protein